METPIKPETIITIQALIKLDRNFETHLVKLLELRKKNPIKYNLAILKLNAQ